MSSHYIIRDHQEPALLLLQPLAVNHNIISGLLEWQPTIIIGECALEYVFDRHIKVDAAVVTHHVNQFRKTIEYQTPVEIIPVKNQTIYSKVNKYCNSKGLPGINIINHYDPLSSQELHKMSKNLSVSIYDGIMKYHLIRNGVFRKWTIPGKQYLLNSHICKISGLLRTGESTYRAKNYGNITVECNSEFWVGEVIY
ncbi:MAG: hypothetical protein OEX02_14505 [Cyclobacteriaceae bacterium]|nr:hypothetical protein [Cyclobacteriaceae bacterium]